MFIVEGLVLFDDPSQRIVGNAFSWTSIFHVVI